LVACSDDPVDPLCHMDTPLPRRHPPIPAQNHSSLIFLRSDLLGPI
jgi:hypothetical protein